MWLVSRSDLKLRFWISMFSGIHEGCIVFAKVSPSKLSHSWPHHRVRDLQNSLAQNTLHECEFSSAFPKGLLHISRPYFVIRAKIGGKHPYTRPPRLRTIILTSLYSLYRLVQGVKISKSRINHQTQILMFLSLNFFNFQLKCWNSLGSLGTQTKHMYKCKIIIQTYTNYQNTDSNQIFSSKTHLNLSKIETNYAHKS